MSAFLKMVREQRAALAEERAALLAEADTLAENRDAFDANPERGDEIIVRLRDINTADGDLAAREADLADSAERAAAARNVPVAPVPGMAPNALDVVEDRSASPRQLADALVRSVEARDDIEAEALAHVAKLAKRHGGDDHGFWARSLIVRASSAYESAFAKMLCGREFALTDDERRALAVSTGTQGGLLVPTHLDPTIIYTNSGVSNAIRPIARVVTLTQGNVWNGVSSAGVTASWDGELTESSDDSPELGAVSVPLYAAQAFVAASFQQIQDTEGLAAEVGGLLADAKDRLEAAAHATGSGNSQPTGIFTALDANTNVELTSATAAQINLVDLQTVYRSVPVRWRGRSTWVMNPLYLGQIQQLGTAVSASFSTNITEPYTNRLLGRPVVESDEAPTTQTTNVRDNEIVFGDFSNYVIIDKPGSAVMRFIPDMVSGSNGRPIAASGWHMFWRTGADSVNDSAFRLLQDKTG
jgi:HK97 family phage major capsid protein